MECESHFEELVRVSGQAVTCPECGAGNVLKQLSTFAVHGAPAQSVAPSGGTRSGGCCGGSCGCGH
jgi:putative FmdB family regulatory protein